jgi:hypothetical protein
MFYRLLGRIFFYFWVLPYVYNVLEPVLKSMLVDSIEKSLGEMTPERRERYERSRRYSHGTLRKDAPPRPRPTYSRSAN